MTERSATYAFDVAFLYGPKSILPRLHGKEAA